MLSFLGHVPYAFANLDRRCSVSDHAGKTEVVALQHDLYSSPEVGRRGPQSSVQSLRLIAKALLVADKAQPPTPTKVTFLAGGSFRE